LIPSAPTHFIFQIVLLHTYSINRYYSRAGKHAIIFSSSFNVARQEAIPEPGPCPECSDANGYWDGSTNFVCIACGHEWLINSMEDGMMNDSNYSGNPKDNVVSLQVVKDVNGNILESGDTVILTKELGKGLKQGLKVLRIRVGDFGDDHNVQAAIPGLGTFNLKSQYLKKAK
jgi:protein PhnA